MPFIVILTMKDTFIEKLSRCQHLVKASPGLTLVQIKARRQKESQPVLEEIHAWLVEYQPQVVPKSLLGQAISYALSNWKALNVYINLKKAVRSLPPSIL
jgi:hypothetical protein